MDTTQGMSAEVQEAISRRGLGQQQAPQLQGGAPASPAPQMPPMAAPAPQGQPSPQMGKQDFVPKNGTEFILTTLAEQLKNDNKLEMEKLKFGSPMLG
mgnify:CR=1 FL=1